MLICHCRSVNDRTVREAIVEGARDPEAVARRCGAGAECGGCLPALRALLHDARTAPGQTADTVAA